MSVYEVIKKRRTIRKFLQKDLPETALIKMVDAARLAPQGANVQPMKYLVINEKFLAESLFSCTKWAAYINPEGNPKEYERPVAYIVALCDCEIKKGSWDIDAGAAIENMLLVAVEEGLGTCWLGAINREKIRDVLGIPEQYYIHSMIAVGYPAEEPQVETAEGAIEYYKDANGVLHVPKRKLDDIIFYNEYFAVPK